jgi:putative nucleotidyltransferase-like protein
LGARNPRQGRVDLRIWAVVDDLIDRAPNLGALRSHGLQLLAARRWHEQDRTVAAELVREQELAAVRTLLAPALLARIRDVSDEPIVVFKGPEVGARYPDPALRPFIDVDLLVRDPERAQAVLLEDGFEEVADPPWTVGRSREPALFARMHHTRPLMSPGVPLKIELHRWPSWPRWLTPPDPEALLATAVPSSLGPDGVMTLSPAEHALVLAAHSWVHQPLGRVRDLLDVTLLAAEADREEIDALARRWGLQDLWQATISAAGACLLQTRRLTLAQRTWARNVPAVRERTVLESHVEGWISCYWTLGPLQATGLAVSNIAWDLRPAAGESWTRKLRRAGRAVRNALSTKSAHDSELGTDAQRFSPVTRWRKPPGPDA